MPTVVDVIHAIGLPISPRSAWPGSAKGATKDRVLLLERALLSVPSIEVRTAMLSSQTDVLVE
jgi:hypothetical protein